MSFRPATSGWQAGDATGSFSLHGSPDGREKLGQQPAPPGADPRKNDQPDEENEGGIGERGDAAGARVREAERERWWSLSRRLYLPQKDLGDATIVTLSSGRGRQMLAGLTVAWGRSSVRLKALLAGGATILFAFCGAGLGVRIASTPAIIPARCTLGARRSRTTCTSSLYAKGALLADGCCLPGARVVDVGNVARKVAGHGAIHAPNVLEPA
jgi:hypothetical protein